MTSAMTLGEILGAALLADKTVSSDGEKLAAVLITQGFMILPRVPNDADLNAIQRVLPISGGAKSYAREAYEALAHRRFPKP